ncbi:MAG: hypothetical protein KA746_01765 [Pyrinomonadaceae bacterium]|nr:hypothetical protein [Pyrinomonadaceae bacterium]MBP6211666.1 hypothetical protein [Pyrinomonadaceae bacterium]
MKKLTKILIVLIAIVAIVQIPFIYRRYQTGKRAELIAAMQGQRQAGTDANFVEYKGIIHAHTSLGGHSTGGFDELIDASNSNALDFVVMTEHYTDKYDTSALTLNGTYGKTLFIGGNEVDTADSDRFLMIPGSADAAGFRHGPTSAFLAKIHAENRIALITYPEKFKTWDSAFDGIEVFSLNTAAKKMNPFMLVFDMIWSGSSYPQLTFAGQFKRPDVNLKQFDEISASRRISLFAGTDGHSNIGLHMFGVDTGGKLLNIKLDPYETVFGIARMHAWVAKDKAFSKETLIEAIRQGNFFTGVDAFGDTSGFWFAGTSPAASVISGGETNYSTDLELKATSPVKARIIVLKNGEKFREESDVLELAVKPDGPGVYRVEIYLDAIGETGTKMPWILSNPIYVR